jgi:glycosyltransferase involved in cell wall biosynthesis
VKVCYLTPEYPPLRSGGIGTSIAHRARALVAAGHDVLVEGLGPPASFEDDGVRVRFEPVAHPPKLGWAVVPAALHRRLRRVVAAEAVDLVVAPDWLGLSAGVHPGCPVVIECNGSATYFGDELGEPVRPLVRRAERRAVGGADLVLAVSRHVGERTRSLFALELPVTVVNNGIDVGAFAEVPAEDRDADLVLHVGTLVRKKGVLDMATAFAGVHTTAPNARLEVVGPDAPDRRTGTASTWQLMAERLGPAGAGACWSGTRDHDQMAEAYQRAALLLVPSFAEAQPMVWLEAMATGLPVVAYDLPWAREVVSHGETGLLVPPGDVAALQAATRGLLADPGARARLGRAAAQRVRTSFADHLVVEALLVAYQAAICGRPIVVQP